MKSVDISWHPVDEVFVATGSESTTVRVNAPHAAPDAPRSGFPPAELLLAAAGTCSAWDVVEILRKQRQEVDAIDVRVTGEQAADPPWPFRRIELEFTIRGKGISVPLAERAVQLSEERYCSVIATVRGVAEVTSTLRVEERES